MKFVFTILLALMIAWPNMAQAAENDRKGWKLRCEASLLPDGKQRLTLQRHLRDDGSFSYQHGFSRSAREVSIGYWLWGWREESPDVSFGFSAYSIKKIGKDDILRFVTPDGQEIKQFVTPELSAGSWLLRREDMLQWLPLKGKIKVELRRASREAGLTRLRHAGHFDAGHLRAELMALPDLHAQLDTKQKNWQRRCIDGVDLVDDPNADIWCPTQFRDANTYYSSTGGNLQAQINIGESMKMNVSRSFFENAPAQTFVDEGLDAFADLKWFVHATLFNRRTDAYKQLHHVEITNGNDKIAARAIGDRVDYKILRKWDARETDTVFTLYGSSGEVIEQARFAPGTLKRVEDGLRGTVAAALKKRENPLKECEPPQEIIIT